MNKLKTVDLEAKYFECDGRRFYKSTSLSFDRYRELQKYIMEFGFNATFIEMFKNIRTAWDYMNSLKLGEAAVILHNMMIGIKSLDEKYPTSLRMCALFFNEEGEDLAEFNEAKMTEKIDCWARELEVTPFFQLASKLVPSWINAYRLVSKDGLVRAEKEKEG